MDSYEYTFPVEQWRQILANVSPGDLCNVVLTSRYMNSVASLPELWAGMKVNKAKLRENGLAEFCNINRFKRVKQVNFEGWQWECGELERLVKEIPRTPLQNANLMFSDLSEVSAELLASAVSHLHIVNLWGTRLTTDQCVALLKASLTSTTLRNVNLKYVNLRKVPAELLASSISRLQEVNLSGTDLTTDQCIALLKACLSSTTLRYLNLEGVNLSEVPAELLANSISRLQEVNFSGTVLTTDQCIELLKASISSTTLRDLDLEYVNLSQVPAELLANSISRLQEVNLSRTHLRTDQCVELFKACLSSTTLRYLNLEGVNLSEVPTKLLANSIIRLQIVKLCQTDLTTDQCIELLKASLSSITLRGLNLVSVNLSEVPAELLANSISRLREVNICHTDLTTDQCVELLKACLSSTTLRYLNLEGVNLSEVPAELLANSISRLQKVKLCRTHLTPDQCVALLKAIQSSTTLCHIDLMCNDITEILPTDQQYLLTSLPAHVKVWLGS